MNAAIRPGGTRAARPPEDQDHRDARTGERAARETIAALSNAGVSVFRLNFSHGTHEAHRAAFDAIRAVEAETRRPIAVMADLQGPKLRVGTFDGSSARLSFQQSFVLDDDPSPGTRPACTCRTRKSSKR